MKYISKSISDTARVAGELLGGLPKRPQATMLALYGDLGSGKTTFVQELGKLLGIKCSMQSPTFVIIKSYDISYDFYNKLIHVDAYRLEREDELARLGWSEIINDPKNLIAVEWAERVEAILPKGSIKIHFKFIDDTTREIEMIQ